MSDSPMEAADVMCVSRQEAEVYQDDAQRLLAAHLEIKRLRAELAEAQAETAQVAADYQDIGRELAKACDENDARRAEIAWLRAQIDALTLPVMPGMVHDNGEYDAAPASLTTLAARTGGRQTA